jgi:hypothetical protein
MARRALLVGINDYHGLSDLRGCLSDVSNMRYILKTYLGFTNNDIRVVEDSRATKEAILYRLNYMAKLAQPGDFMVFHFSGHGSQIRDRSGDELEDAMDELLCPADFDWEGNFILDDELDAIFSQLPEGCLLEVFLDCCHSGDGAGNISRSPDPFPPENTVVSRYLPPPPDIAFRHEGEESELGPTRGFKTENRFGKRSTRKHILWSACRADQKAADINVNGTYNGAFTYFFCKHIRETGGFISRRNLLERVRESLHYNNYRQDPELMCMNDISCDNKPLQFPPADEQERTLFLTTPYLRGNDVRKVQEALLKAGVKVTVDGVFGPHTHTAVKQFQEQKELPVDGIVEAAVRNALFGKA